jgi:hypothetical protein
MFDTFFQTEKMQAGSFRHDISGCPGPPAAASAGGPGQVVGRGRSSAHAVPSLPARAKLSRALPLQQSRPPATNQGPFNKQMIKEFTFEVVSEHLKKNLKCGQKSSVYLFLILVI